MTDRELLDILYRRIQANGIRLNLHIQGDGWAQITVKASSGYQFDAVAHKEVVRQGA